jgi:DNA-binding winged helix-turn-helix (wHTH) protein
MRVQFGDFTLDRAARQLVRGGRELHLEPKAYELLDLLLARRPAAVSKREIRDQLWPDTFVSESSLTDVVAQLRAALGDDRRRAKYVRTLHGFGYAFAATAEDSKAATKPLTVPRVIWERLVFPLGRGENVLGRDGAASVRIDSFQVSRRHARIVVTEDRAVLEDLDSKNGTFLNEERLPGPTELRDGDTFRLGRLLLVYRSGALLGSTRSAMDGE